MHLLCFKFNFATKYEKYSNSGKNKNKKSISRCIHFALNLSLQRSMKNIQTLAKIKIKSPFQDGCHYGWDIQKAKI